MRLLFSCDGIENTVANAGFAALASSAGALTGLGSMTTATGQTGVNAQAANDFNANLMRNVTNNMASAVVSSAINGKPLNEESLSTALSSALITAGMAQAANSIGAAATGTNPALNSYTQAMAHALAGCVGGAATTGTSTGCSAGAVGAVVGELSAGYAKSTGATDANALAFARSMSAVAGALVGGPDSAAAVNVAAQMGANAAQNNYLNHVRPSMLRLSEKERYDAASASCANGDKSACGTRDDLAALSQKRDQDLIQACSGSTPDLCKTKTSEASSMGNIVTTIPGSTFTYANSPTPSPLNTATIGNPTRSDSFHDQAAKSTSEAIVLEVGNQTVGALIGVAAKGVEATKVAVSDFFASQGIAASDATTARIANNFGKDGDAFTTAANQMVAAKNAGWTTSEGRVWYPPNNGAVPGTNFETTLPVGAKLDRYGGTTDRSTFLAPAGTQFEQRALPASTNMSIHDQYVVLKPLPVEQSNTMPWFGQQGMGVQFNTDAGGLVLNNGKPATITNLVEGGYLKKVSP
jgi:Tuberculosis necrotizing toxin/Possible hemagglutinin (DUF637)